MHVGDPANTAFPLGSAARRPRTPLVGRRDEVARVVALLGDGGAALVTLTGPGGVGKTRVALQAAAEVAPGFADGASFVDLQSVRDPDLVLPTIAQTLGLIEHGGDPLLDQLAGTLSTRTLLLVLDNVEQVAAAAPSIADLLTRCPGLKVLATSRVLLRVSGEYHVPVAPLPMPEAVALFVARAEAANPRFAPTPETAPTVEAICARLDGLPLAIELAAARLTALPLPTLLARLTTSLALLTDGPRDRPDRLRTLRAAIDGSYDLLTPRQQRLFRALAVFDGGFGLDAAEAVAGGDGAPEDVLNGLIALVEHSLVQPADGPQGELPRYRMLETIREYGLEHVAARGETQELRRRHAEWFVALAEAAEPELNGPDLRRWQETLGNDLANLRAAVAWGTESDLDLALRILGALAAFWVVLNRTLARDLRDGLDRLLATGKGAPQWRGKALGAAARIQYANGSFAAAATYAAEAVDLYRALGDQAKLLKALFARANADLALAQTAPIPDQAAFLRRSEAAFVEMRGLAQKLGDERLLALALGGLAGIAMNRSDGLRAIALLDAALAAAEADGDAMISGWMLLDRGRAERSVGANARAAASYARALGVLRDLGDAWSVGHVLKSLAMLALDRGRAADAVRVFAAGDAIHAATAITVGISSQVDEAPAVAALHATLSDDAFAAAWEEGAACSFEHAADLGEAVLGVIGSSLGSEQRAAAPTAAPLGLTSRERDVLRLLANGNSDREIAEALSISPYTVHGHVSNLLGKLGVGSRTAAAAYAHRHGLV